MCPCQRKVVCQKKVKFLKGFDLEHTNPSLLGTNLSWSIFNEHYMEGLMISKSWLWLNEKVTLIEVNYMLYVQVIQTSKLEDEKEESKLKNRSLVISQIYNMATIVFVLCFVL